MLHSEMAELLTVARSVDRREITPLMVEGWMEAMGHVLYGEARRALAEHHRTSTDMVKPAHLLALVDEERRRESQVSDADRQRRTWMVEQGIDWHAWERGDAGARAHAARVAAVFVESHGYKQSEVTE